MKNPRASRTAANSLPAPGDLLNALAVQNRPLRLDALLRLLHLHRSARRSLEQELAALAAEGRLLRLRGGLWVRPDALRQAEGRFCALREGGGLVTPLGSSPSRDIYIPAAQTGGAWHQDRVRVALTPGATRGRSPEGRVVAVLERALAQVPAHAGRRVGDMLFCHPADARLPVTFRVALDPEATAPPPGGLLLLTPTAQLAAGLWSASIAGSYGREDAVTTQETLVKLNHGAPQEFPPAAMAEAAALPAAPRPEDMAGREDLRHLPFVTIDGDDARDFDDAVQVDATPGGWLLRVAIADVSHYVRPRGAGHAGALDAEARARGNSWYFPCSVAPMLPPVLSNGLCSLNPGVDRLAVLVELPVSRTGQSGAARFALAVLRSAARLTYHQVKACLLDRDCAAQAALRATPQGSAVLSMLERALALSAALRAARLARGALDFDMPEADCRLDEQGRVDWLGLRERNDAHRLIEECMLAANEAVARALQAAGLPFLYRVHPHPDPDRLRELAETLSAAGLEAMPSRQQAGLVAAALAGARGTEREFLINRLCLRAMPQARYQPENTGHFGLASQAYCHFTSPIRRYADLLTHRALKLLLGRPAGPVPAGQKLLRLGEQCNRHEREAMEAEREMRRRLGCLALRPRLGEHLRGIVAGVMDFGLFVELEGLPVEGMIRVEDLGRDWYDYDARSLSLTGRRTGVRWHIGLPVEVMLAEADLGRLAIRLVPLSLPPAVRGGKGGAARGRTTAWQGKERCRRLSGGGRMPSREKARRAEPRATRSSGERQRSGCRRGKR